MQRSLLLACLALSACSTPATITPPESDAGRDASPPPPPPEVTTPLGVVRGIAGDGYREFLGIPYARPPLGDLRWRAPEPHPGWSETFDASRPPPPCVQDAFGLLGGGEEDCLVVNVHTPDPAPSGAPVIFWIHGGGFTFGEGVQLDRGTRGDVLARERGVVVVSVNYRLAAFGFLAHAALGSSGNEGFEDQQAALRWVANNIASFGGDPANVTLVGESAGGLSVCMHLVADGSRGLFARAITQSGLCDAPLPSHAEALAIGGEVATALGCDTASDPAACMRALSARDVRSGSMVETDVIDLTIGRGRRWWPHVDGSVLADQITARVRAGELARVPVIVGWNADEGTLFVGLAESRGATIDQSAYDRGTQYLAEDHGLDPMVVRDAYPPAAYEGDPGRALSAALGHARLACPSLRMARALRDAGSVVRVYRFEYTGARFQLGAGTRPLGAFHSAEIQFVFGHPTRPGQSTFMGDEAPLHDTMSGYWSTFARAGDPNGDARIAWAPFEASEAFVRLDAPTSATGEGPDRDACAVWQP